MPTVAPPKAEPSTEQPQFKASSATGTTPSLGGTVPAMVGGNGRTFYIDFAKGVDSNSGTSASQPWKHAPGDSAATGLPAKTALQAGDTVRFKAGVPYRGTINVKKSGTAAKPIIYTGSGFGQGRGVWDGADPAKSAAKCTSQAACGGASNWRNLWLITYAIPKTANQKIYDMEGPLFEAMAPVQKDAFWGDDINQFVSIPLRQVAAVTAGRLENAALAEAARNEPNARLSIWVYGNEVQQRKIKSVSGNIVYFDATGLRLYTDRDTKAAIVGAVRSVTKPGLYALLGNGKAIVYPRAGGGEQYSIGNGRYGFFVHDVANIVVHGMDFVHGTAASNSVRDGVAILGTGAKMQNIRFEGNRLYDFSLQSGQGAIYLHNVAGLTVRGNRLDNLEGASGMRIGGNSTNVLVEGNSVRRLGRTGIYLQTVNGATVRNNIISDVNSVHGNAFSFYLAHQNVTMTGNCVFNSTRPLTFHGDGKYSPIANLKILNNIFIANGSAEGRAGLASWGNNTRTVTIENNIAIGRSTGLSLHAADKNVRVVGNLTAGTVIVDGGRTIPTGWTISNNNENGSMASVSAMTLTQTLCSARGKAGILSANLS